VRAGRPLSNGARCSCPRPPGKPGFPGAPPRTVDPTVASVGEEKSPAVDGGCPSDRRAEFFWPRFRTENPGLPAPATVVTEAIGVPKEAPPAAGMPRAARQRDDGREQRQSQRAARGRRDLWARTPGQEPLGIAPSCPVSQHPVGSRPVFGRVDQRCQVAIACRRSSPRTASPGAKKCLGRPPPARSRSGGVGVRAPIGMFQVLTPQLSEELAWQLRLAPAAGRAQTGTSERHPD